jgi:hypothetical protein
MKKKDVKTGNQPQPFNGPEEKNPSRRAARLQMRHR